MKKLKLITALLFALQNINAQELQVLNTEQPKENCISKAEYEMVETRIATNKLNVLLNSTIINQPLNVTSIPALKWPLREADNFKDYSLYYITNYVDLDNTAGIKDYTCGNRTYDGHSGSDIALNPFPWLMMDNQVADIVAAAPGTIWAKAISGLRCQTSRRWSSAMTRTGMD